MKTEIVFVHLLNDFSGSPKILKEVIDSVGKKQIKTKLYIGSSSKGFLSDCGIPTTRYWYHRSRYRILTLFTYFFSQIVLFHKLLFDRSIDKNSVIYVNTLLPFGAALYGRLTKKKVIYHLHEISITPLPLKYLLTGIAKKTSSLDLYVSNAHLKALPIPGPPTKRVYNSLDTSFIRNAVNNAYTARHEGKFNVLLIASLRNYKGIPELFDLASSLLAYSDVHFDLVVNDDQKHIDQYFSGRPVPSNLTVHPFTSDTTTFYQKANLVLNLSRVDQWVETFGMTILEAMAFGIPVIVPPEGGPAELVKDGVQGFQVDSRNSQLLKEKVLLLYNDQSLCQKMSSACRSRAADFSPEVFNENIIAAINDVREGKVEKNRLKSAILGTRGIPARYGGFETFAEELAQRLVLKGIEVTVYCESGNGPQPVEYKGIELVYLPATKLGPLTTIFFDIRCLWHARRSHDVVYMLGYGAAPFCVIPRFWGTKVWINVDGIEWARAKWNAVAKFYFKLMELFSLWTADRIIADAEGIKTHLQSRHRRLPPCTVIPYGAPVIDVAPDENPLKEWGLKPRGYYLVVARLEPENHILEMIEGYKTADTSTPLVVVGDHLANTAYIKKLLALAGPNIRFIGGVYEKEKLQALRFHSEAYFHGHSAGGTNPSLLEALGCGNLVIAHDNPFNREVMGDLGFYFRSKEDIPALLKKISSLPPEKRESLVAQARSRMRDKYDWDQIAEKYAVLLKDDTGAKQKTKSPFLRIALFCMALLMVQVVYFLTIISSASGPPDKPGAVVVFGGGTNRSVEAFQVAKTTNSSNLIVSDNQYEFSLLQPLLKGCPAIKAQLDNHSKTTDANARNTALMVKQLGVQSVVLVTSWYHMPRALFLMRLYLVGSGVKVYPVAAEKPPGPVWSEGQFWLELVKFWGSLGRVALVAVGIRDWPKTK